MIYLYTCHACNAEWEENFPIDDRDKIVGDPCPHCEEGKISRGITAPGLNYGGAVSAIKKAGTEWNDVLKGIKKASGKNAKIDHY